MKITSYSFGEIIVEGKKYTSDLIIFPHKIIDNWWREKGHLLQLSDLEKVIEYNPDILVIATGKYGKMNVSNEVIDKLQEKNIKVHIYKTNIAVKEYNKIDGKKVCAIHLSC